MKHHDKKGSNAQRLHKPTESSSTPHDPEIVVSQRRHRFSRIPTRIVSVCVIVALLIAAAYGTWALILHPKATPPSKTVKASVQQFAYNSSSLFLTSQDLSDDKGNTNYSPASMWTALSMAEQGAAGTTKNEMQAALNDDKQPNTDDYHSLMLSINGRRHGKSKMQTANSIWIQKGHPLDKDFRKDMKHGFSAEMKTVSGDASEQMSSWVDRKTHGILKPNFTDDNAILTLLNTVYANGKWQDPFDADNTSDQPFHGEKGDSKVSMMSQSGTMDMARGKGFRRLDKAFDDGSKLKIVLPDQKTAANDLAGKTDSLRAMFNAKSEPTEVDLSLPKFKIANTFDDSISILRKLGIRSAFNPSRANFSKMTNKDPLYIGRIIQGTSIDVGETGVKAAAYNKIDMKTSAPNPGIDKSVSFIVDHPFLYEYDTPDGVPLFVGIVRNL
ncbi:hypothetical protein OZX72_03475 [Bifidobacterium sp. ESL0769]|uniref:serpin family protein n=1 Tax=Bifidobacterium sp. ESL0769 TaxID=2983229 RepID=UPI0023F9239F|nr:serpin family protein [Bifidobacterium sp. ESL0769]WEV68051.1 hypothetical protein OZX72_03475 [Bifidobacterium sp. ESL0769]